MGSRCIFPQARARSSSTTSTVRCRCRKISLQCGSGTPPTSAARAIRSLRGTDVVTVHFVGYFFPIVPVCMRQATIPALYSGNRYYFAHCHTGYSHLVRSMRSDFTGTIAATGTIAGKPALGKDHYCPYYNQVHLTP